MEEDKQGIKNLSDFVLCPNGELGTITCYMNDNTVNVHNSFGNKSYNLSELVKLDKLKEDNIESNPYFKDKLNPNLWKDEQLLPDVKEALNVIYKEFIEEVEQDEFKLPVLDVYIVGSNASYNYTDHSDIDIHILTDFNKIAKGGDTFFVKEYFEAKRKLYEQQHDITIRNHDVELYIEDCNNKGAYNGIYSLLQDKWIQKPSKEKVEINSTAVQAKFDALYADIAETINEFGNLNKATKLYKKLFKMRREGLAAGGEFCVENLVFKKLRDNEIINNLRDYMYKERDKELSLEAVIESFKF